MYGIGPGAWSNSKTFKSIPSLSNDETITAQLERLLNEELSKRGAETRVEIINAAVSGYCTFQHVFQYYERLYKYEPDMLVFVEGQNDFYLSNSTADPVRDYKYSSVGVAESINRQDPVFAAYIVSLTLGEYSYFSAAASRAIENVWENRVEGYRRNYHGPYNMPLDEASKEHERISKHGFLRAYRTLQTIGEEVGFSIHVFIQPQIVYEPMENLSPSDATIKKIYEDASYGKWTATLFPHLRPQVRRLLEESSIPYSDLGQLTSPETKGEDVYVDMCHVTPLGAGLVAERMFPIVLEEVLKREGLASVDN